jgi:hypothetical protein
MGFTYDQRGRWKIGPQSPTLWVEFCDQLKEIGFESQAVVPGDVLEGQTLSFDSIIQSIFDDFNGVANSYLRLARYPDDFRNPPDPAPGDDPFTIEGSEFRIIDVCIDQSSNPFLSGHAKADFNRHGDRIYCKIVLIESVKESVKSFVQTLTHELGHCLGLGHPQETKHAIMSYHFDRESNMRLMIDDKMGLTELYKGDGVNIDEKNTFGLSCGFKQ